MVHPVDPDAPQVPVYDPPGGELGYTIAVTITAATATASLRQEAGALATNLPVFLQNMTGIGIQQTQLVLYTLFPKEDDSYSGQWPRECENRSRATPAKHGATMENDITS